MISHRLLAPAFLLAFGLLGVGVFAGCNVFEGFYEEGGSDDPEILLQDAAFALRSGEPDKAVRYLERALARDPDDPRLAADIRSALASALLRAHDISVLTLDRIASDLLGQLDATDVPSAGKGAGTFCSFDARGDERRQEVVMETTTFQTIRDKRAVLDRVIDLLNDVFQFPDRTPTGIQAGIERMKGLGYGEQEIQSRLFVLSVAYLTRAYIDVVEAGLNRVVWYRVIPAGGGPAYLGFCAESPELILAVKRAAACAMDDLLQAVELLEARVALLGLDADTAAASIAGEARDAYDRLAVELAELGCGS
ncbi:MAG: tetratricopeptide repeat protein [Bacteroidetes bacterium]|nr:hypothetical protein AWN76_018090 [Rhodothermaceae bacterium RA]RMH57961.1 MAG: tetratricopeptide repeat protein [Bacteroidota bacterium]